MESFASVVPNDKHATRAMALGIHLSDTITKSLCTSGNIGLGYLELFACYIQSTVSIDVSTYSTDLDMVSTMLFLELWRSPFDSRTSFPD